MVLDAGVLISVDRGERAAQVLLAAVLERSTPLATTHPVVAQVWRDGARQARLARFLTAVAIHPFDDGPAVGALLARSATGDVVDAHVVVVAARRQEPILTGDVDDMAILTAALPGPHLQVLPWP